MLLYSRESGSFLTFPLPFRETLFTRAFCHSASFLSCSHHAIAEALISLTRSVWFGGMERTKVPSYPAKTPRRKRSPSLSPLVKLKVKSSRFKPIVWKCIFASMSLFRAHSALNSKAIHTWRCSESSTLFKGPTSGDSSGTLLIMSRFSHLMTRNRSMSTML